MNLFKAQACLCALLTILLLAGCGTDFEELEALTLRHSGSFELDMTQEYALPLFTAPGEKLWISSWDPIILYGDGYEEGTVWVTTSHGRTTYWLVVAYDTKTRHAQYVRVTPGTSTGTVDVSVTSNGDGGSIVNVTYQLTGLSDDGNEAVAELLNEPAYAEMMEEWQSMINSSREKIDEYYSS